MGCERFLTSGQGVQDLRLLARTCDDPDLIQDKVTGLLERHNVSERAIAFLDATNILDRLIAAAEGAESDS